MTEPSTHLSPSDVGRACNMSRRKVKHLLKAAGIAECGDNGRWFVRVEALRERLPDVYARVVAAGETQQQAS